MSYLTRDIHAVTSQNCVMVVASGQKNEGVTLLRVGLWFLAEVKDWLLF